MRRLFFLTAILLLAQISSAFAARDLTVGVTPFPHRGIMEAAAPLLAQEGYNLVLVEFTDYVQPNLDLADGEIFANFFQHQPYLDHMNRERGLDLVSIGKVHIEPMALYSRRIGKLDALKKGDSIAVPNDPTNEARALRLLESAGLITVGKGEFVTVADIIGNPLELKFHELVAAQIPYTLDEMTAAVINANFAGEVGLNPARGALAVESGESPYANVIAVRGQDRDSPAAKALLKAVQSQAVKEHIRKNLVPKGFLPAF